MSKHIFWLASYPKSGNTLLRSILVSLFFTEDGIFNLKLLPNIDQFESTRLVHDSKNLFENNYNKLSDISIFYKYILKLQDKKNLKFKHDFRFYKTHSGNFSINGHSFTKEGNIRGIFYIIRDPRDVCISWSKHSKKTIDESLGFMTNDYQSLLWNEYEKEYFSFNKRPSSYLSSWEKHVISWSNTNWKIPIFIIKFEDLVYKKKEVIMQIVNFFTKNYNFTFNNLNTKINNIIKSTSFEKLRNEEEKNGFNEAQKGIRFFSSGKKNQWVNRLSKDQIIKIEKKFKTIMNKFNYKLIS